MSRFGKLLQIQHYQRRIGQGLAEYRPGVLLKCRFQLFLCTVRIYESSLHTHFLDGVGIQIVGTAIESRGTHNMISGLGDVHDGVEVGRLPGRCQHGRHAALQITDLGRNRIIGGVLETGVEIPGLIQVKQTSHLLAGAVFKCSTLVNGKDSCLSVSRHITGLDTFCLNLVITHQIPS